MWFFSLIKVNQVIIYISDLCRTPVCQELHFWLLSLWRSSNPAQRLIMWSSLSHSSLYKELPLLTHKTDLIRQKDDGDFPSPIALMHGSETELLRCSDWRWRGVIGLGLSLSHAHRHILSFFSDLDVSFFIRVFLLVDQFRLIRIRRLNKLSDAIGSYFLCNAKEQPLIWSVLPFFCHFLSICSLVCFKILSNYAWTQACAKLSHEEGQGQERITLYNQTDYCIFKICVHYS